MPMTAPDLITLLLAGTLVAGVAGAGPSSGRGVHAFKVRDIGGRTVSLADYRGKVLLIVNTASRCGFTPQYEGLEKLRDQYRARGFEVLAFPANDFMNQEPGSDAEIQQFCTLNYQTSFPLFSKIRVKGREMHPLFGYLTSSGPKPGAVGWNFTKFLVDGDGKVVARFEPRTAPGDAQVHAAIEALLAAR